MKQRRNAAAALLAVALMLSLAGCGETEENRAAAARLDVPASQQSEPAQTGGAENLLAEPDRQGEPENSSGLGERQPAAEPSVGSESRAGKETPGGGSAQQGAAAESGGKPQTESGGPAAESGGRPAADTSSLHHYHGNGTNSGVCHKCGEAYYALTEEEKANGIMQGDPSKLWGIGPDGKLMPGWMMGPNGYPIRDESFRSDTLKEEDGCPFNAHLHSGGCTDRWSDGCWRSGHSGTGTCDLAPKTSEPDGCPLGAHTHTGSCSDLLPDGCWKSRGHIHGGSCTERWADGCWVGHHTGTGSCELAPRAAGPAPSAEAVEGVPSTNQAEQDAA